MKKEIALIIFWLGILSLACSLTQNLPIFGPTATPTYTPSPTPLPATPTPTATPTPLPSPTPLPAARITSGDRARFYGDWDTALAEYRTAFETSPEAEIQSAALLGMGRTYFQAGEVAASLDSLKRIIDEYPDSSHLPYAYFSLGQAYERLGQFTQAAEAYLQYMILRPGVIDAYVLNLRGDALRSAGDFAGAMIDYRAALQSPSMLNGLEIEIKIAQSHAAVGDYGTALGMYQDIYQRSSNDLTKARLDYLMGQAYTAMGELDQAYNVYLDAVNSFPTAYDAYRALLILVNDGVPVNELKRGIVDYHAGQYGVALAAFDRYFRSGATELATARYYNGLTNRALGGYQGAIDEWDKLIALYPEDRFWDDAWEQKAYTQWQYLGDYRGAIQTLTDFVSTAPNHPRAPEFLFDAALVAERDGQLNLAAELWERVAVEYPGYEQAFRALYLAGVTRYRLNDFSTAFAIFQRCLANAISLEDKAAAYLWQGKAQQALGNPAAAQAAWESAAGVDPTGYYSERARDLLLGRSPFSPPQMVDFARDQTREREQAEAWLRATFQLPPETDLTDPGPLATDERYMRGMELWELGLDALARAEFEGLRLAFQSDPVNSYRLANVLADIGLYRSAILSARQVLNLAGMSDAQTLNAPAYFNHLRFGTYFSELVIPAAQKYEFHPLLLFSVIRQESAFEGFVRSSAGARGLMQIIPSTGQEIVQNLGWPPDYTAEDLYRPQISIVLGTDYLATWRDHLGGDLYAALAAYNGGPGNAIEWQKLANGDPDVFLEVVRFEETRNYIRGIYEIFNIYRRIYNRTP